MRTIPRDVPRAHPDRRGQSLVELLVAIMIGAIMVGAGATIIAPVLRSNTQTVKAQVGAALGKELLDNVTVWAEGDWHNILNLATSSANTYYLTTSTSPFVSATGTENLTVGTTTYTRYFYVDNVQRDTGGAITTNGGSTDPSTKKVTVVYQWPQSTSSSIQAYLTRSSANYIFDQTDWSGGPGQNGPVTSTNSMFSTSTAIDYATTTGSIYIKFP